MGTRGLAATLLALLGVADAGCGRGCTAMYAPSTVTITFDDGDWAPGLWALELNGYTQSAMCVLTLPYTEGDVVSCTANLSVAFDAAGGITSLTAWEYAPPSFVLWSRLDGVDVGEVSFTPAYDVDTPNGEGCGERSVADLDAPVPVVDGAE